MSDLFNGVRSENPWSADNQQERLITIGWIIGFVDGEGCFSVCPVRQQDRLGRKGYKTGVQVQHEFVVTQGARSIGCLQELKQFFGVGQVIPNHRTDNHRDVMYRYVVRKRSDLLETVIPFFRLHPLRTSKRSDFECFAKCVVAMGEGLHLAPGGLADILEHIQTMNRQKSRTELIRILRDFTPNADDSQRR
jgi:LAGLIDADG endonuclease